MTKYWLLSYPRTNTEISVSQNLIGGKSTNAYERLFKEKLSLGDKLVMAVTGEGKIRGIFQFLMITNTIKLPSGLLSKEKHILIAVQ